MTSPRDVAEVQATAFRALQSALKRADLFAISAYSDAVAACALVRLAGQPARSPAHFGTDPLDVVDPPESEAEYVEREIREARG